MRRCSAPPIQRPQKAADGCLQYCGVKTHMTGFSECLVDAGRERDDTAEELASRGLPVRCPWPCQFQHADESRRDLGRQIDERGGESPAGPAEIGPGEDKA